MIHFACPHCRVVMSCPDARAGSVAPCPKCRGLLTIPPAYERPVSPALPPMAPVTRAPSPLQWGLTATGALFLGLLLIGGGVLLFRPGKTDEGSQDGKQQEPERARNDGEDRDRGQEPRKRLRGPVQGNYPPATSTIGRRTATEWAKRTKDLDLDTFFQSCEALKALREEGMPYLLEILATDPHIQREARMEPGAVPERLQRCIFCIDGRYIDPVDLELLLPFLAEKYAPWDESPGHSFRGGVATIFDFVGPKARAYLPQLQAVLKGPIGSEGVRRMVMEAIAKIEK